MAETAGSTSSTEDDSPSAASEGVMVGRVVGAHGLHGVLRIRASGDALENLASLTRVWLVRDDGGVNDGGKTQERPEYEIASVRPGRSGECRLTLHGVTDRDAAEALRGLQLLARADALPPLEPGEFYAYQLVGCRVETTDECGVGVVRSILETGGRDLLVIETPGGGEALVPAVEPLLVEVDLATRRIVIDPPPGLLEGDTSEQDTSQADPGEPA